VRSGISSGNDVQSQIPSSLSLHVFPKSGPKVVRGRSGEPDKALLDSSGVMMTRCVGAVAVVVRHRGASGEILPLKVEDWSWSTSGLGCASERRRRVAAPAGQLCAASSASDRGRSHGPLFLSDRRPLPARRASPAKHIVARCNLVQPISLDWRHDSRPKDPATAGTSDCPCGVSADRSGATIVGELIEQIDAIRAITEEPESPVG